MVCIIYHINIEWFFYLRLSDDSCDDGSVGCDDEFEAGGCDDDFEAGGCDDDFEAGRCDDGPAVGGCIDCPGTGCSDEAGGWEDGPAVGGCAASCRCKFCIWALRAAISHSFSSSICCILKKYFQCINQITFKY